MKKTTNRNKTGSSKECRSDIPKFLYTNFDGIPQEN